MPKNSKLTVTETVETVVGKLIVTATPEGVTHIDWLESANGNPEVLATPNPMNSPLENEPEQVLARHWVMEAAKQLQEYFRRERSSFDVPCVLHGTEFQVAVWNALLEIPYGETRSYGDIAKRIGREKAVRAVGQANRANPIPIVVPCHRVIGSSGQLVGYAGSKVHLKAALLELEQITRQGSNS